MALFGFKLIAIEQSSNANVHFDSFKYAFPLLYKKFDKKILGSLKEKKNPVGHLIIYAPLSFGQSSIILAHIKIVDSKSPW